MKEAKKFERYPISPMKRNKINDSTNEEESPKKKLKMPTINNPTVRQFNLSESNFSPKTLRSTSLCENPAKKSFARFVWFFPQVLNSNNEAYIIRIMYYITYIQF